MSAGLVPTSSAVMYRPARRSTKRPWARNSFSRSRVLLSPMMIALPPPRGTPAAAHLLCHPSRKTKRVDHRLFFACIVPEARAANGRAKLVAVDRNDAAIAGRFIVTENDLLV